MVCIDSAQAQLYLKAKKLTNICASLADVTTYIKQLSQGDSILMEIPVPSITIFKFALFTCYLYVYQKSEILKAIT